MPRIFTTVVKKMQAIGGAQFAGLQNTGIKLSNLLTNVTSQSTGIAITQRFSGTTPQKPGVSVTASGSGTSFASQNPALELDAIYSNSAAALNQSAAKVVQIKYDLVQTNGSTVATSTGNWQTPANAQGLNNGTTARIANTITAAANGALTLAYAAQVNKTSLTITNVVFNTFVDYTPGLIGPGTVTLEYSVNGGTSYTVLVNGSPSARGNQSFDITTRINNNWNSLSDFRVRFNFNANASTTPSTLLVDAVELVVTATTTQTP